MTTTATPPSPPPSATTPAPPPPRPPGRSSRSGLWIALVLVGLVILGAGALAATVWLVDDVEQGNTTVAAVDTIRFRGDAAELTVVEADRADVDVAWETRTSPWRDAQVDVAVVDGVLEVTADCRDSLLASCSTEAEITVPAGSLATLDAMVDVGELRLVGSSAEVVASTDVGEIALVDHRGTRVVLRTGVGSVEVDAVAVPTEVEVQVGVGEIDIVLPEAAYDVDATTDVGSAATSVRQVDGAPNRIIARTDVGDVNVVMR